MAENTNLIRKKIAQRMGKHIIIASRETTSPTAVITSDTCVETTMKNGQTVITVGRESTYPTAVIASDTWESRIHKIKTITQKYYNKIEVRIEDIDAYCEPDRETSANIMEEYQFKAL